MLNTFEVMKVLVLVSLIVAVFAKHEQYLGWKSYYVGPSTPEQFKQLGSMEYDFQLDFLSRPNMQREGVVLVRPEYQDNFVQMLRNLSIAHQIHVDNIKAQLDYDDQVIEERNRIEMTKNGGKLLPYDNYQELEVIYEYLDDIALRYPDLVTLVTPANSFEGRPIKYLKISTTKFQDTSKPVIVIDGGIHAREWISPPTVTWAIHKLVEDVTESDLLEDFDWVLLPIANPDGYKFSFTNTRFWRKTRSTNTHSTSHLCPGVDGNRNYDFFWNTVGTSNNPCSDTYAGNVPFSEIETRVVRDILKEHLDRIALYLTMHSFGSMILYPWGHDGSLSDNGLALHTVGVAMADAIYAKSLPHFPRYIVGNAALVLWYAASGASEDYAHSIGVPLSYTYELPGLSSGFNLNPRYIQQVSLETWDGIAAGARLAKNLFRK